MTEAEKIGKKKDFCFDGVEFQVPLAVQPKNNHQNLRTSNLVKRGGPGIYLDGNYQCADILKCNWMIYLERGGLRHSSGI